MTYLCEHKRGQGKKGYIVMLRARMFRSLIIRTGIKERNIRARNIQSRSQSPRSSVRGIVGLWEKAQKNARNSLHPLLSDPVH